MNNTHRKIMHREAIRRFHCSFGHSTLSWLKAVIVPAGGTLYSRLSRVKWCGWGYTDKLFVEPRTKSKSKLFIMCSSCSRVFNMLNISCPLLLLGLLQKEQYLHHSHFCILFHVNHFASTHQVYLCGVLKTWVFKNQIFYFRYFIFSLLVSVKIVSLMLGRTFLCFLTIVTDFPFTHVVGTPYITSTNVIFSPKCYQIFIFINSSFYQVENAVDTDTLIHRLN